jgi:hypothetical protein
MNKKDIKAAAEKSCFFFVSVGACQLLETLIARHFERYRLGLSQ